MNTMFDEREVLEEAADRWWLFLLTGILLGAVWAGEAWGRPWGWDMKETWALITLIGTVALRGNCATA